MKLTSGIILAIFYKYRKNTDTKKNGNAYALLTTLLTTTYMYCKELPTTYNKVTLTRAMQGGKLSKVFNSDSPIETKIKLSNYARLQCIRGMTKFITENIKKEKYIDCMTEILAILCEDTSISNYEFFPITHNSFISIKDLREKKFPRIINMPAFFSDLFARFFDISNGSSVKWSKSEDYKDIIFSNYAIKQLDLDICFDSLDSPIVPPDQKSLNSYLETLKIHNYTPNRGETRLCSVGNTYPTITDPSLDAIMKTQQHRIYIEGAYATGKTNLLTNLCREAISEYNTNSYLPIHLDLGDYDNSYSEFMDFIKAQIRKLSPMLDFHVIQSMIESGHCLFLMDNLDELNNTYLNKELLLFIEHYDIHKYIITGKEHLSDVVLFNDTDLGFFSFKIDPVENRPQSVMFYKACKTSPKNMNDTEHITAQWQTFEYMSKQYHMDKCRKHQYNLKTRLAPKELLYIISILITEKYIETNNNNKTLNFPRDYIDDFLSSSYIPEAYRNKIDTDDFMFDIHINIPVLNEDKLDPICPYKYIIGRQLIHLSPESAMRKRLLKRIEKNKDFELYFFARTFNPYSFDKSLAYEIISAHLNNREKILKSINSEIILNSKLEGHPSEKKHYSPILRLVQTNDDNNKDIINCFIAAYVTYKFNFKKLIEKTNGESLKSFIAKKDDTYIFSLTPYLEYRQDQGLNNISLINDFFECQDISDNPLKLLEETIAMKLKECQSLI